MKLREVKNIPISLLLETVTEQTGPITAAKRSSVGGLGRMQPELYPLKRSRRSYQLKKMMEKLVFNKGEA